MIAKWFIKENSYYDSVTHMLVTKKSKETMWKCSCGNGNRPNKDLLNNVGL